MAWFDHVERALPVRALFRDALSNGTDCANGVPREQKMLKGHLPRVIYYQVH
jgi:hypothetical protein